MSTSAIERVMLNSAPNVSFDRLIECEDEEKLETHVLHHSLSLKDCSHVCRLDETDNRLVCLLYSNAYEHPSLSEINSKIQYTTLAGCAACLFRYVQSRTLLIQALEHSYDAESVQEFMDILREQELNRLSHAVQNDVPTRHIDLLCLPPSWLEDPAAQKAAEVDETSVKERAIIRAYLKHEAKVFEDPATAVTLNLSAEETLILVKCLFCQLLHPLTAKFARTYIALCPSTLWQHDEISSWRDSLVGLIATWFSTEKDPHQIRVTIRALITLFQMRILRTDSPLTNMLIANILHIITKMGPPETIQDVFVMSAFMRATVCEHKFWTNTPG